MFAKIFLFFLVTLTITTLAIPHGYPQFNARDDLVIVGRDILPETLTYLDARDEFDFDERDFEVETREFADMDDVLEERSIFSKIGKKLKGVGKKIGKGLKTAASVASPI